MSLTTFFLFKLNIYIYAYMCVGYLVEQHMAGKTSEPNRFETRNNCCRKYMFVCSNFNYTCFHKCIIMCFKVIKYFEGRCMLYECRLFVNAHLSLCSFMCVCVVRRRHGAAGEGVADAAFVAVPAAPPPSKGVRSEKRGVSVSKRVVPQEKKVSLRSTAGPPGGQLLPKDTQFTILNISTGMRQNIILLLV